MDFVLAGNGNEPVEKTGNLDWQKMRQSPGPVGNIVILEYQRRGHCGPKHASAHQADEPKRGTRSGHESGNNDIGVKHDEHNGIIGDTKAKSSA